jgi:hypothetical protein
MWMRRRHWIFLGPLAIVAIALFVLLGGEIVKLLWNALLPQLFGLREITFWQALGLLALSRILFGGLGMRGASRQRARRRIEDRMAERWEQMTPEERERMRGCMPGRWGAGPASGEGDRRDSPTA